MTTPKPKPEPKAEPKQAIDLTRLVRCIEEVEGGQWNWPGGRLRITRAFWDDHGRPYHYRQATDSTIAYLVAERGLASISEHLVKHELEPTVALLAKCWNQGVAGAMQDPKGTTDYMERVNNLYRDKEFSP